MRGAEAARPRTAALRLRSARAPVSPNPHAEAREEKEQERLLPTVDNPSRSPHTCCGTRFGGVPSARTPRTPGMVRDCLTFMGHTGWMVIGWKGGGAREVRMSIRNWEGDEWGGESLQNNSVIFIPVCIIFFISYQHPSAGGRLSEKWYRQKNLKKKTIWLCPGWLFRVASSLPPF